MPACFEGDQNVAEMVSEPSLSIAPCVTLQEDPRQQPSVQGRARKRAHRFMSAAEYVEILLVVRTACPRVKLRSYHHREDGPEEKACILAQPRI